MLSNICSTTARLKWLFVIITVLYLLSITAGLITRFAGDGVFVSFVEKMDEGRNEQVEKIFGRFRQSVRDGDLKTIVLCSLIVFGVNTLGSITSGTLPSIFILPIGVTLLFGGWVQGISLGSIQASSFISLFLFLLMGCLEWSTYVISSVVGVNIGLSVLIPKRQGVVSRWKAFKLAWRDAGRLYVVIVIILAFQAVFEVLYVRKVLLMGGSAIPLMPY